MAGVRLQEERDFRSELEPLRGQILAHSYRMLGSLADAEDAVQETFLRAWGRRETFAGNAALGTWLYSIATRVCLDALAKRKRRKAAAPDEMVPWLEPFPTPEQRTAGREHLGLAFIAALQRLPPRQRAALLLRDVLGWSAAETAEALGSGTEAVNSSLRRARTLMGESGDRSVDPPTPETTTMLTGLLRAWEAGDISGLVKLLADDITLTMPPRPAVYQGLPAAEAFLRSAEFKEIMGRGFRLVPSGPANGQLAYGVYRWDGTRYVPHGIQTLILDGPRIQEMCCFKNPRLIQVFGLPPTC